MPIGPIGLGAHLLTPAGDCIPDACSYGAIKRLWPGRVGQDDNVPAGKVVAVCSRLLVGASGTAGTVVVAAADPNPFWRQAKHDQTPWL